MSDARYTKRVTWQIACIVSPNRNSNFPSSAVLYFDANIRMIDKNYMLIIIQTMSLLPYRSEL